jgi:hypothetical protein
MSVHLKINVNVFLIFHRDGFYCPGMIHVHKRTYPNEFALKIRKGRIPKTRRIHEHAYGHGKQDGHQRSTGTAAIAANDGSIL